MTGPVPAGSGMRTIVVPFRGTTPEENDEGKKMAALTVRALEQELRETELRVFFEESGAVRTGQEALTFGRLHEADVVIWGEVVFLYGEVEIQPRLTWVKLGHFAAARVGTLSAKTTDQGQIALRRAKAGEVAAAAVLMAALHHQALGNLDEAIRLYRRYSTLAPAARADEDLAMAYARLWWCFTLQHKIADALAVAREGVGRLPSHPALRAHLGMSCLRSGRPDEGVRELLEAARLDPGSAQNRARLAFGYVQLNRIEEAIALGEEAARMDPQCGFTRSHLGTSYLAAGRIEEALEEWRRCIQLEPENHEHRRLFGVGHLALLLSGTVPPDDAPTLARAQEAFAEACRLAPHDLYNRLLHRATRSLSGAAGVEEGGPPERWPGAVFRFFDGQASTNELLAATRDTPDESTWRARETEANFYLSIACFRAGDTVAMADRLTQCTPENMFEDIAARGILRRRIVAPARGAAGGVGASLYPPFGKFKILRQLGRGGMGIVYEALDSVSGRRVAIKTMIREPDAEGPEARSDQERFLREARVAQGLRHPHIVAVREAGVVQGRRYIAMDLIEGEPMELWMRKSAAPTLPQSVMLLRDVSLALHYAHEQGLIHRDLKPANILVDAEGRPHVMDFGLAKTLSSGPSLSLTGSGVILGTPYYMSPEQARGLKSIDRRTDVFSLGVMLYEAIGGRTPFTGENAFEILRKVVEETPVPPASLSKSPEVDAEIERVCLKALSKRPEDRHATAGDFAADLSRWIEARRR